MSTDVTEDQESEVERSIPLFKAFNRDVPTKLVSPARQLSEVFDMLERDVADLEKRAAEANTDEAKKVAAKYREEFNDLQKKADKELAKSFDKEEATKKLQKAIEEVHALDERVNSEAQCPARQKRAEDALKTLKERDKGGASKKKIESFEKEYREIAKEKDPNKRCEQYAELERNVARADLQAREEEEPGSTWQQHVEFAIEDARPAGRVKGFGQKIGLGKTSVDLSDEEFASFKTAFVNANKKKIGEMAEAVPGDKEKEFRGKAEEAVKAIAEDVFHADRKPGKRQQLGQLLMQANTRALQDLGALKRAYPAQGGPQARVHEGKIRLIKPTPKAESLVLQGGGGKGAGYPPLLEEMNKAGILKNVNVVIGTSIGALNASCLACGGLTDERQILDINLMGQAFDPKNFKKSYPGVTFGHPEGSPVKGVVKKIEGILPSCAGEMAKIDQLTASSVALGTKQYGEEKLADELGKKLSALDDATLERLGLAGADEETIEREVKKLAKKVKNQDFKAGDRTDQMITFKDIAILHQLDPANFKELTITGWEGTRDEGKTVFFNAKDFPDMPVALAARVSMGLPVIAPLYWKGRGPFYDGGLGANAPMEAAPGLDEFYKDKDPSDAEDELRGEVPLDVQDAMSKTMLMTFDDQGKAGRNLYGEGRRYAPQSGGEQATVIDSEINPLYGETLRKDANKAYNSGVNTLVVDHGEMDTLSLGPLSRKVDVEFAENISRMRGLEQLDERSDQAVEFTCDNADEALVALSSSDKRRLVEDGRPEGGDKMLQELFDKCEQYLLLEDALDNVGDDALGFLDLAIASPLGASSQSQLGTLRTLYNTQVKTESDLDALTGGIEAATQAVAGLPKYLQPMLKKAVLLPMQQRRRGLAKSEGGGGRRTFNWQKAFTADAFENTMATAEKVRALSYLKPAKAVHGALEDYEKADGKLGGGKPKDECEKGRKALKALEQVLVKLRLMKELPAYQGNATLQEYVRWLEGQADGHRERLRGIAKGKDAAFGSHHFVAWNNDDWQKRKQEAIDAGAIQDPKGTGLSKEFQAAVKASRDWDEAPLNKKEKTAKEAWKAWDKVIRTARGIQALTDNANFSAYMEECISEATSRRDKFPPL